MAKLYRTLARFHQLRHNLARVVPNLARAWQTSTEKGRDLTTCGLVFTPHFANFGGTLTGFGEIRPSQGKPGQNLAEVSQAGHDFVGCAPQSRQLWPNWVNVGPSMGCDRALALEPQVSDVAAREARRIWVAALSPNFLEHVFRSAPIRSKLGQTRPILGRLRQGLTQSC